MGTWRYSVGDKGVSRVTVFERTDATSLYVEWFDDLGRHKQAISTVTGHPITDKSKAMELAKAMSARQEIKRNQSAAMILGLPSAHTLGELLTRRHDDLEGTWTKKYKKDRERMSKFWLGKLGKDMPLVGLNPATVERLARNAQGKRGDRWLENVLQYLVDSYSYAEEKLKWIEARHNLSAVTIPRPKGRGLPYSREEARKLLPALWKVNGVAGWLGQVVSQTGRRIGAARKLKAENVMVIGDWTYIDFPGETDKTKRSQAAAVYKLPERKDWTIPPAEHVNDWIHEAEKIAEVPHKKNRGWHAMKRLYAELTEGMAGADTQAATRRDTLSNRYRHGTVGPKQEVAMHIAEQLGG